MFFDRDSGYFEPVHGEGTKLYWEESTGDVTPSSSQATLYLTDENMGPVSFRPCLHVNRFRVEQQGRSH